MTSAELKVVGTPPLSALSAVQRREFTRALLEADALQDLPGKWPAAILTAASTEQILVPAVAPPRAIVGPAVATPQIFEFDGLPPMYAGRVRVGPFQSAETGGWPIGRTGPRLSRFDDEAAPLGPCRCGAQIEVGTRAQATPPVTVKRLIPRPGSYPAGRT
jgi:hypothetical protein